MSHFSEVKTKLKNKEMIIRALEAKGYSVVQAEKNEKVEVSGFFDQVTEADFKVKTDTKYEIGFVEKEGVYQVVADWDVLSNIGTPQDEFTNGLKREYAKQSILELAKQKNYEVEMHENPDSNEMEITVSQW